MSVRTSAVVAIDASIDKVFDAAAAVTPSDIFQAHFPIPGVAACNGHAEPWSAIGETRELTLTDKSSVLEELIAFTRASTFAYRVQGFVGLFGLLAREAKGEWHFTSLGENKSQIDWTYSFSPTGPIAEPLLWFVVKLFWPRYQRAALKRIKSDIEAPAV
ncbi:MAG: SRPBCC family protein [Pseudomonadota bacterium]